MKGQGIMRTIAVTDKEIIEALNTSNTVGEAAAKVGLIRTYTHKRIAKSPECQKALEALKKRKGARRKVRLNVRGTTYSKIEDLAKQLNMPLEEAVLDAVLVRLNERSPF